MKLIDNWKLVLTKAYSIKLMLLASFLTGLEVVLPYSDFYWVQKHFPVLIFIVTILAMIARLLVQKDMTNVAHKDT